MTEWFRLKNPRKSRKRHYGILLSTTTNVTCVAGANQFQAIDLLESKQVMRIKKISNKLFSVHLLMGQLLKQFRYSQV
jgi:hypothetical protein